MPQVDGVNNPKVQSVFFDDMPVHRAAFADGGAQVGFSNGMILSFERSEVHAAFASGGAHVGFRGAITVPYELHTLVGGPRAPQTSAPPCCTIHLSPPGRLLLPHRLWCQYTSAVMRKS